MVGGSRLNSDADQPGPRLGKNYLRKSKAVFSQLLKAGRGGKEIFLVLIEPEVQFEGGSFQIGRPSDREQKEVLFLSLRLVLKAYLPAEIGI